METPEEKNEIAVLEKQLEPFFKHNPHSKVRKIRKGGKFYYITNPWNDKSVAFILKGRTQSDLIAALNNIILPPRFTALYHLDSNTMEYIYTLLDEDDPCYRRQFDFTIDGKAYSCKFRNATDRLLILSKFFRRAGQESETDHRNLPLLREYIEYSSKKLKKTAVEDYFAGMKPISFFVTGFERFHEDEITEVSKHLNFFMQYYDRESPTILIHSAQKEIEEPAKQLQFVETGFPTTISTRSKDTFLLGLALAAMEQVETRLQFLYYYQILEYASFYYIRDDTKRELLKIINAPDIHSNPEKYIPRILDTVGESRQEEEAKIDKIIKTWCSPDIVWNELQQNLSYFCKKQEFEGGFILDPFISEDMTLESFSAIWHPKTSVTLRYIRNALVHGREKRFGLVIAPTQENDLKLSPWISVIRRVAEQVLIFG